VRGDLPTGTVTFLFTDVEGSTRLLHELGAEGYAAALAEHRRVVREAFRAEDGVEVDTQGDAFFVAFPTAPGALRAVEQMLAGLAAGPIRVRMGVHTGTPFVAEEGYVGVDVNRAARIAAVGHGGQVLVSSSAAALLGTDGLRDLGEHRLKDLSAPERIFQLGDGDFPPLTSLHRTNLPVPATPFLGRERELGDVLGLLEREDVRLLTLTGPGGTGKTRLALQAAGEAAERFPHGLFWVPLAALGDPELVLETAASTLGAGDGLAEHIGDKELLLLLDNFEHVVDAAAGLPELLARCPGLQLVVTSRELLRVPGEQAYPVPTLEPGDGADLFGARARAADPAFGATAAVPELCARLDNLPLALELAAARVRVLSPEQLLERLSGRLDLLRAGRGADPRQQTLRATIEWSHDLLDEDERRLFARLAVFAGGCTLEAAEEVCDAELDVLESLVDKSLVRVRDGGRFWMLETIREFAAERLESSGEPDELRRRHAEWFLALAEEAEPHLFGGGGVWVERLAVEHDNIRAALDRLEAIGETQLALRLAGSMSVFWEMKGNAQEGRRRLERLLRADEQPTLARGKALNGAAAMALQGGDTAAARQRAEEGLALHRTLDDDWGIACSELELGLALTDERRWSDALRHFEHALRIFGERDDQDLVLLTTRYMAWMHNELGDRQRAQSLHEANLERARATGSRWVEATTLSALGEYAADAGLIDAAASMLDESTRIWRELGDPLQTAVNVSKFAKAAAAAGEPAAAARLLGCSEAIHAEHGAAPGAWLADMHEAVLSRIRTELDDAALAAAREEGRGLSADQAVAHVLEALRA
jgi:predicted ATPase/class 3 adenylate cyclase